MEKIVHELLKYFLSSISCGKRRMSSAHCPIFFIFYFFWGEGDFKPFWTLFQEERKRKDKGEGEERKKVKGKQKKEAFQNGLGKDFYGIKSPALHCLTIVFLCFRQFGGTVKGSRCSPTSTPG